MSVERERLIPVTSEAELRVGMLVERQGCPFCGRAHRCLMTSAIAAQEGWHVDKTQCRATHDWRTAPVTCGQVDWGGPTCFCYAIAEGRLFIVDPFSESDTPTEAKRPAPRRLERAR